MAYASHLKILGLSLLALGLSLGTTQGVSPSPGHQAHPPADPGPQAPHGDDTHHGTFEIPPGQAVPTLNLAVHTDALRGWNLEIQTTDFRFAPEQVNQANQPNVGHGHLYIDGEKLGRVYGPWVHLVDLPPGRHQITVSLNTNRHQTLTHQGQPIAATVEIVVP
ncbi:MAG: hypothetical protein VKO01_10930 [Cyanobacteriota bacterium]|nr:hypothetical protein [Cyanobacteriota bacterium]